MIAYGAERGIVRERLLAQLQLSPAILADPDMRLPLSIDYAAIEHIAEVTGDPVLGLHYIDAFGFKSIDALGYLAMFSATVGEAMERFVRYLSILSDGERLTLDVPPFGLDEYQRIVGYPPIFEAPENRWSFPESVLTRRMLHADPALAQFFDAYVSGKLPQGTTAPLHERVKQAVSTALIDRVVHLPEIARRLHMSARTLQRRLSAERLSFDDIVSDMRRVQAQKYLQTGMSISEISYLLGYSDPAAFRRAFKRWTGRTPGESRTDRDCAQGRRSDRAHGLAR